MRDPLRRWELGVASPTQDCDQSVDLRRWRVEEWCDERAQEIAARHHTKLRSARKHSELGSQWPAHCALRRPAAKQLKHRNGMIWAHSVRISNHDQRWRLDRGDLLC